MPGKTTRFATSELLLATTLALSRAVAASSNAYEVNGLPGKTYHALVENPLGLFLIISWKSNQAMKPTSPDKQIKTTTHSGINGEGEDGSAASVSTVEEVILKIPALTWVYWAEKMTATTFGETFADMWSQTLGFGYGVTSGTLMAIFFVCLAAQLYVKHYWPPLFWAVMATSSIAGTLFSDFIDRSLHWGYPVGMAVLLSILMVILGLWKISGLHMNVAGAMNRKQEFFYWAAILVSNTLGTALGDFLADSLELGFGPTAGTIGAVLVICALLAWFTKVSHVFLFWVAFILTRPFGATFGDLLTKGKEEGGLDLGTLNASMVILGLFLVFFAYEMYGLWKAKKEKEKDVPDEEGGLEEPHQENEDIGKGQKAESDVNAETEKPHHHKHHHHDNIEEGLIGPPISYEIDAR
jgi:uncharacterized membrane-anchored protein